jgi:hypothetical protein
MPIANRTLKVGHGLNDEERAALILPREPKGETENDLALPFNANSHFSLEVALD